MAFATKLLDAKNDLAVEPDKIPASPSNVKPVLERTWDGVFLKFPNGTREKIVGPNAGTEDINAWFKNKEYDFQDYTITPEPEYTPSVEEMPEINEIETMGTPIASEEPIKIVPPLDNEPVVQVQPEPQKVAQNEPETLIPEEVEIEGNPANSPIEEEPWWGQGTFNNKRERFGLMLLVVGVLFISIVSVSHLINYFGVGNSPIESWLAAIAFEILSFGSIAAFVLLPKIKRWALWSSLFLLYILQLFGNTYSTFDFVEPQKAAHFFDFFGLSIGESAGKRVVAILLSAILPTVSFIFMQLIKPYFKAKDVDSE